MLSSLLNLPRRRKSGPACQPVTSPESNREEDGFLLLGQSESERNTIMPSAASTCSTMIPPPPSYEQVTGTPPSLPPAAADLGYHGYRSPPSNGVSHAVPTQTNHPQTVDNRTSNTAPNKSPNLNRSGNSDWGIFDVPFEMSPKLRQSSETSSDYFVMQLPEVDWRQYDYDFQFEEQVKKESEMALENMEDID